jgi:hypothetical protein
MASSRPLQLEHVGLHGLHAVAQRQRLAGQGLGLRLEGAERDAHARGVARRLAQQAAQGRHGGGVDAHRRAQAERGEFHLAQAEAGPLEGRRAARALPGHEAQRRGQRGAQRGVVQRVGWQHRGGSASLHVSRPGAGARPP